MNAHYWCWPILKNEIKAKEYHFTKPECDWRHSAIDTFGINRGINAETDAHTRVYVAHPVCAQWTCIMAKKRLGQFSGGPAFGWTSFRCTGSWVSSRVSSRSGYMVSLHGVSCSFLETQRLLNEQRRVSSLQRAWYWHRGPMESM